MLEGEELYRRFDEIVPGEPEPDGRLPRAEIDIYFERLSMAGLEEMHAYSTDVRLYEYFEFAPFENIERTRAYIEKLRERMGVPAGGRKAMYWFVRRKADRRMIGTACLVELNYNRQSADWGYAVDPAFWGHGYILQIQAVLQHYAFEVLNLNRLSGVTMVENQRTIASVLAAGMRHEGTAREYYRKDGVYHDAWLYGMLRADYLASKQEAGGRRGVVGVEEVRKIVAAALADDSVTVDSGMHDLFSWDSLTHMSIMVAVSQQTGVSLSSADMTRGTSVRAIAALLAERS